MFFSPCFTQHSFHCYYSLAIHFYLSLSSAWIKKLFFFSFLHFILLSVAFISIILRFSLPHRENVCEIKTCNDNGHFHEFSLVCGLSIVLSVNLILFLFTYLILYHRSAKQTHTNTPIETPFVVVADLQ